MSLKPALLFATALFAMLSHAPAAHALPAEICEIRAALVAGAAGERDKGVSKKKVIAMTMQRLGPQAKGFVAYIDLVYSRPQISPDDFYKITKLTCLNE